jgi:hypothetical protein
MGSEQNLKALPSQTREGNFSRVAEKQTIFSVGFLNRIFYFIPLSWLADSEILCHLRQQIKYVRDESKLPPGKLAIHMQDIERENRERKQRYKG